MKERGNKERKRGKLRKSTFRGRGVKRGRRKRRKREDKNEEEVKEEKKE